MYSKTRVKVEEGVVVGNVEDKAQLRNPVSRYLVQKYDDALMSSILEAKPESIHEVGCGEGRLTELVTARFPVEIRASDISSTLIESARARAPQNVTYAQKCIYELTYPEDHADTVICCEVLEHLDTPLLGLERLRDLRARQYILSVPWEPVWRLLNLARGRFIRDWGNTPGHLNHWSRQAFERFLEGNSFRKKSVRKPLPWTMICGSFD